MPLKIADHLRVAAALNNSNLNAERTTPYVDISGAREIALAVFTPAVKNDATARVQFYSATSSGGAGSAALGDPITITGEDDVNFAATASIALEGLPEGHNFVAAKVVETGSPSVLTAMGAVLILASNRYNGAL